VIDLDGEEDKAS